MLVLSNETSPRWFAKHLIAMSLARNRNMSVIIVPKLKELTKKVVKTPAIVLGILDTAKSVELEEFYNNLDVHKDFLASYLKIETLKDVSIKKKKKRSQVSTPPVELLKRTSDARAFVPMDTEPSEGRKDVIPVEKSLSSDFIAFSKLNVSTARSLSNAAPVLYRPIKIKQIAGNPNRKKLK